MFDIILAVCCLVAGLCAGIKFSERYTEKFKFYKSISIFNERLYTEISFFRNGICSLGNGEYLSQKFEKVVYDYSNGKDYVADLPAFLTASQKSDIIAYFSSIGKSDAASQKELYGAYKEKFGYELSTAANEQAKYSALCKKTGLIVGLAAFVILF